MTVNKNSRIDFNGQLIYVGIDVHKKFWQVSIYTKDFEHKTFSSPPEVKVSAESIAAMNYRFQ